METKIIFGLYYILLILFTLVHVIIFMLLDINKSPTNLKVYQDIIEYYQVPHRTDVISNIFTDYEIKVESSVIYVIIISFCFEMIILTIGCLIICCSKVNSDKPKIIYNYFCNIILITSKIVFMKFLLKLRNNRIKAIKPVISEYIKNERDINEFNDLNNKAAEKDLIFFIINLIVCIIIFIIILIITISIFKDNGFCDNCNCNCACTFTRRNYNNGFTSNNNIINNMIAHINNNNANNAYGNININIRQSTNAIINSNENVNNTSTRNLTKTKYKGKNNENCIICQQLINFNDEVIYLPCLHFFHDNCINIWINKKKICPICRVKL